MRFSRIYNVHIPMAKTDLVFKATELEVPVIKAKHEANKNRDTSRLPKVEPMPEDGEHDPYRAVDIVEIEMKRIRDLWGHAEFDRVYRIEEFATKYEAKTIERNAWAERKANDKANAEAKTKALEAAKTAELVHLAIAEQTKASLKQTARTSKALEQADRDTATLAAVGVGADLSPSIPTGRKA